MTDALADRDPIPLAAECDRVDGAREIWRSLAVSLDSRLPGSRPDRAVEKSAARSLVVTSIDTAYPDIACKLAAALASLGLPTCLVDGGARFSGAATGHDGMARWPVDEGSEVRLTETDVTHLTVVRGGPRWEGIADAPRVASVRRLTDLLSDRCRRIIWSGPPLSSAAGMAVAGGVDGILLVVTPGRLTRNAVRRAQDAIASVQGHLLGVVLSDE
jgi:Mrp family chromosome partitioning ATPase